VHVFGLGVRLVMQVTLESNYLLQQMELIFHLEDGPRISEYIKSIGVLNELVEKAVYLELGTLLIPGEWKGALNV
jgi:hypothetical protein